MRFSSASWPRRGGFDHGSDGRDAESRPCWSHCGDALDGKTPDGPIEEVWEQTRFNMKLVSPANRRKFRVIMVGSGLAGASAAAEPG